MSWLFSQALVAEYSAATCSGGAPSAPLSVMPTQHKFWRNDRTIEPSRLSLFGLTCAVLTESHGEALLTSFLADSRVRTYPLLVKVPASKESGQAFGRKWYGSFAKYNPDMSLWKTAQGSLLAGSEEFSEIWPAWGFIHNGDAYQRESLAPRMREKESGLWPTLTASDSWAAPKSRFKGSSTYRRNLSEAVRSHCQDGQLNPGWAEWLMGWPIGWTELKPLGMDKFREWRRQHSPCLVKSEVAA